MEANYSFRITTRTENKTLKVAVNEKTVCVDCRDTYSRKMMPYIVGIIKKFLSSIDNIEEAKFLKNNNVILFARKVVQPTGDETFVATLLDGEEITTEFIFDAENNLVFSTLEEDSVPSNVRETFDMLIDELFGEE